MQIKMDPGVVINQSAMNSVAMPAAMDEGTKNKGVESVAAAEFGKNRLSMTTGTYAEEMARQLDVKEVKTDLDVMDPANFISQCMTGEDAHDLSEEGTPLEEYVDSSLDRALVRVREQRAAKQESTEAEAEKLREVEESIREKSEEIAADARLLTQMSQALAGSELPIREKSLDDLVKAKGMVDGLDAFGDPALRYMVANETKVTPKSIQDSLYGSGTALMGKTAKASAPSEMSTSEGDALPKLAQPEERKDGFEQVKPQIETRLEKEGIDVTPEKLQTARWLYQNELPVTNENIDRVDTVQQLREMDDETLLSRLVSEMEDGMLAEGADLSHLSKNEVEELVEKLTDTSETDWKRAYPTETELASARRQMEEIRLTMTVAAAREMTKLGVTIDIGNLEEMVDQLRAIEQQAKEALFEETGLDPASTGGDRLIRTMDAAETVLGAPVELLSYTFDSRQTITLQTLSAQGQILAESYVAGAEGQGTGDDVNRTKPVQSDIFRKMEQVYEAVGTEVRSDLGDSIRKAFGNMGRMLDELGLPKTAENERAVRILGYNRMEISVNSVLEMKTYDRQVNEVMEAMKPQVVKKMIEENINPLELSLEELSEQVTRIREESGAGEESFARFLWKLDRRKEISEEDRESMIGIYRLLDKIEKSDGAVIGQLVNEGRELSLKNMLDATRTRKKGHINTSVSDESGSAERVKTEGKSIDAQIMTAFTVGEIPVLREVLSPKAMAAFAGNVENLTPEELIELCESEGESDAELSEYYEEMAETIRQVVEEKDEQVMNLLQEMDVPETIRNRMAASEFLRHQLRGVRELWTEEESDRIVENMDDPDALDETFEEIEKSHHEWLTNQQEEADISFERMQELTRMAGLVSFHHSMRRYQTYEVPLMTEQGVIDCHVTVREGEKSAGGTVEITMDSDELGKLTATFKLSGNRVNGFVTAERQDRIETWSGMMENLEKDLEEIGFTMDGNSLVTGNRNSLRAGDSVDGAKNQDLYRIAKCFLRSMKNGSAE